MDECSIHHDFQPLPPLYEFLPQRLWMLRDCVSQASFKTQTCFQNKRQISWGGWLQPHHLRCSVWRVFCFSVDLKRKWSCPEPRKKWNHVMRFRSDVFLHSCGDIGIERQMHFFDDTEGICLLQSSMMAGKSRRKWDFHGRGPINMWALQSHGNIEGSCCWHTLRRRHHYILASVYLFIHY